MGKWMTRILIAMLCLLTLSIPAFAESEDEGYGWTAFSNTSQNTLTWMNGIPIDLDPSQYEACLLYTSIGCATLLESSETFEHLFRRADDALYRAKQLGKNRYQID